MKRPEFDGLRRNYKKTMDAILSPKFDMSPEYLRELLTQHALDMEEWMDEKWAEFHLLEPCGDYACLYALMPTNACKAKTPMIGEYCQGCFPHQKYLQNVRLYRKPGERASVLRATAVLDPGEYDEVIQQARCRGGP